MTKDTIAKLVAHEMVEREKRKSQLDTMLDYYEAMNGQAINRVEGRGI